MRKRLAPSTLFKMAIDTCKSRIKKKVYQQRKKPISLRLPNTMFEKIPALQGWKVHLCIMFYCCTADVIQYWIYWNCWGNGKLQLELSTRAQWWKILLMICGKLNSESMATYLVSVLITLNIRLGTEASDSPLLPKTVRKNYFGHLLE